MEKKNVLTFSTYVYIRLIKKKICVQKIFHAQIAKILPKIFPLKFFVVNVIIKE